MHSQERGIQRPMFAQFLQFVTDSTRRRKGRSWSVDSTWHQSEYSPRLKCIHIGDYFDQCTILSPPSGQQPNTRLDRPVSCSVASFVRSHSCGILSCVPQHGPKHGRFPLLPSDGHDGASATTTAAAHSAYREKGKVSVVNDRPGRVPATTRQEGF